MMQKLTKEDVDLSHWDFEFQQRSEQPVLICDFFHRSLEAYLMSTIVPESRAHCDYLFTDSDKGYMHPAHRDAICRALFAKVATKEGLREVLERSFSEPKAFNALADKVTEAIQDPQISNSALAEFWKSMDEGFTKLIPWFYYPWYLSKENILTDRVKNGLEIHRNAIEKVCEFDEALMVLVFPIKKTAFQLEQEEMLGLVTVAKNTPNFAREPVFAAKAGEYLKKYDWLTTFILTPLLPMTYDQLVVRVQKALAESFEETLALQKEATKKNEALAAQLLDLVSDDAPLVEHIESARELGFVLTAGIEEAYMSSARYLPLMQMVAARIGVPFEDSKRFLSQEILDALRSETHIDSALVEERKKGFIMQIKDGVQKATFGAEGHELSVWFDNQFGKVDESITELKGQPACKGFAVGKARIALTPNEAHMLEEGEILVTPMTNPDYVPAMRRSAAIVTDEGGLLSHAAIMSREFGKPCVIATKNATRVFKTGDLIEVDAQKGIVRRIQDARS